METILVVDDEPDVCELARDVSWRQAIESCRPETAKKRSEAMARILVVDDDADVRRLIELALDGQGYIVDSVDSGRVALARLAQHAYDLIVWDLHIPDRDGPAVYRAMERRSPPRPAFLFVTGYADAAPYEEFLRTVPVPAWFWRHIWSLLLDKAAVRAISIHDARHTYASLMLRRGVPIAYVSRQLGHASIQITVDLYGHFVPGGDRHHAEGLAAAIEAERVAAEARALSPPPDSFPAPDGTLVAPGGAASRGDGAPSA